MRVISLILACAAVLSAAGLESATRLATLENGLTVIVCERPASAGVTVQVYADAGGAQETPGSTGAFQVLRQIFQLQSRAAGWKGASGEARLDANTFHNTNPPSELARYLDFEASRVGAPEFGRFEEARSLALAERTQREPAWILEEARRVAFFAHPAGVPAYGYAGDLERLTAEDVRGYWKREYGPANLIVTVLGGVRFEEARAAVERSLGRLPGGAKPAALRCVEPPQRAERRVMPPPADRGVVVMAYHKGSSAAGADYPVWDVLAPVLRARLQGALARSVSRVHVEVEMASMKYPGLFAILAFVAPGADASAVERGIDAEVARLAAQAPSDTEMAASRREPEWDKMTDQAVGAELADWYAMTGEYRNFFRHPERVMRVSAEEVQRLARERLRAENRTVAVVRGKS